MPRCLMWAAYSRQPDCASTIDRNSRFRSISGRSRRSKRSPGDIKLMLLDAEGDPFVVIANDQALYH